MQYHLNGFRPGDPHVRPDARTTPSTGSDVDVLIVGAGPAGLILAAQLAEFADITTRIVERKPGPMQKGQADGVSCRSMEMFEAFGFGHRVTREAYWVNQTVFWTPDPVQPAHIKRAGRVQDVEDGLSEMPHVILNQARIHDMFLEHMQNAPARLAPEYSKDVTQLEVSTEARTNHPVTVTLADGEGGTEIINARYVVGCDGARSAVRQAIGRTLHGEAANQLWGVMDILAVTDFPDIRFKTIMQSETAGTILIIPREGGHLVRLYIEHGTLPAGSRVRDSDLRVEDLIAKAQKVFQPYTLEVKDVVWWSAYQIGQRLTDKFDDVPAGQEAHQMPRVFIAGDACHTHSPKAGQGMNVSMGDAFNLGWKLKSVLRGECPPALLHSYSAERQAVAQDLIDFDKHWAQAIRDQSGEANQDATPPVQRQFVRQGRYTAGVAVAYAPSALTADRTWQHLAQGFEIGSRFHSAPVLRFADAKPTQLGHVAQADGRWRIYAFAPDQDPTVPGAAVARLADFLGTAPASPVLRYADPGQDIDARFDLRLILQSGLGVLNITDLPPLFRPSKGRFELCDYEKVFCAMPGTDHDIFDLRGIDRQNGCLVLVRPDQYIGQIVPIDGFDALLDYFDGIMQAQTVSV